MASTSKRQGPAEQDCEREADGPFSQVSGHIYELYRPKKGPVQLEILFFHGLQLGDTSKEYLTTWTNEKNDLWPATWLPKELPQARILSISYDAKMKKSSKQGRLDLHNLAENLTYNIGAAGIGQTPGCPVILVGHCFGGLVIKEVCVQAHTCLHDKQKMAHFLKNLGGVFFYGTPHCGTHFVDVVSRLLDSPLLEYVGSLNEAAARLDGDFRSICQKLFLEKKIVSVGESHKTKVLKLFDAVMVPEASARYGHYCYTLDADHFTICKPILQNSPGFKILLEFILSIKPEEFVTPDNFQWLPREAVGLDSKVEEILKMLKEITTVGIVGMGGIGKTTLAKAVFNKLCSSFDLTCFVPEVKLISGAKEERVNKLMCHMGKQDSGTAWSKNKLLLVFDDIGCDADIDAFTDVIRKAAPDSLCVITTREEGLLTRLGDMKLYRMPLLTDTDADGLFKSYAFPTELTVPSYLDKYVEKIVKKCEGLPLAIEVLGQCLKRKKEKKDEKFWVQMVITLELADNNPRFDRMWAILKYSYDALSVAQQRMFLDATTFFSGDNYTLTKRGTFIFYWVKMVPSWTLHEAKAAWSKLYEGCEEVLWNSLVDACLVYAVEDDEQIHVHEQLKSLGRKIAREDSSCKRVWNEREGLQALQFAGASNDQGIESLRIWHGSWKEQEISEKCLLKLETMKYLENTFPDLESLESSTSELQHFSEPPVDKKRALPFIQKTTLKILPANLVVLSTSTFRLCPTLRIDLAQPQVPPRMVVLKLIGYSDKCLPESMGRLSSLKIFVIVGAKYLETLPDSFGNLLNLQLLQLEDCCKLQTFPDSFGNLSALQKLEISHCDLETLPESFGKLSALQSLEISYSKLETLPESFGKLSALQLLEISDSKLETLPESFGKLSALQSLKISECELKTLPNSFGKLSTLQSLEFWWCEKLQTLPDSFGNLSALHSLRLLECSMLQTLPDSFGNLSALQSLEFRWCEKLQTLPDSFGNLSTLQSLEFSECNKLQTLPDSFGNLSALQSLKFSGCNKLQTLPDSFGNLSTLQSLEFSECNKLQTLPDSFGNLSTLQSLEFLWCEKLQTLPDSFGNLSTLQSLEFLWCEKLQTLPDSFGNLSTLQSLEFLWCEKLQTLPDSFGNLSALHSLILTKCSMLQTLPDSFGNLSALHSLRLKKCSMLQTLPNLSTLQLLEFSECKKLLTLPDSFRNTQSLYSSRNYSYSSGIHRYRR